MESKLQSLKVAELKTLLTNASLPVSGVKADLIARLLENPSAIQHLQDPSNTTQEQPTTSSSTTTTTEISPTQTPTQETPASAPPVKTDEEKHQELIAELEKRKARAKRFGTTDSDAEAKLERALKFGVGFDQDKALNQLDAGLGGPSKKVGGQKPPTSVSVDGNKTQTDVRSGGTKKEEKKQETEEGKADRIQKQEAEEAARMKRAERFGIVESVDEERKRKREEKFGSGKDETKKVKA